MDVRPVVARRHGIVAPALAGLFASVRGTSGPATAAILIYPSLRTSLREIDGSTNHLGKPFKSRLIFCPDSDKSKQVDKDHSRHSSKQEMVSTAMHMLTHTKVLSKKFALPILTVEDGT